jgi:hypothetical protein
MAENTCKFTHGEMVPCIGGPMDGHKRMVTVLFGKLPAHSFCITSPHAVHRYTLDHDRRAWVYDASAAKDGAQ